MEGINFNGKEFGLRFIKYDDNKLKVVIEYENSDITSIVIEIDMLAKIFLQHF